MEDFQLEEIVDDPVILPEDTSIFEPLIDLDDSVCSGRSEALLEDSYSSVLAVSSDPGPSAVSTPMKGNPAGPLPSPSPFKCPPAIPPPTTRLNCDQCSKTYANERTLATHKRMHSMARAALRSPPLEVIQEKGVDLGCGVIEVILAECKKDKDSLLLSDLCKKLLKACGSEEWKNFTDMLTLHFYNIIRSRNVLLPSALRAAVYSEFTKLTASKSERDGMKSKLKKVVSDCDDQVLWLFCGNFLLKFFDKLLTFVFKAMHGQGDNVAKRVLKSDDVLTSPDFQQTLYHIVGAVMHACFVRQRMYKNSTSWAAYGQALRLKCLRKPEVGNECSETVSAFSATKDRGGYAHVNQDTFDFFFKLFELLLSLEGDDGSLPLQLVDQEVGKDDILIFMWDDLIGSELTPEQSLFLLLMITHTCVKIVVRGVIKRRINEHLKKAYSSVALRAGLASTSNQTNPTSTSTLSEVTQADQRPAQATPGPSVFQQTKPKKPRQQKKK